MSTDTATRTGFSSIEVVEPPPHLAVTVSGPEGRPQTVYVDGLSAPVAMEIPWDEIIKVAGGLLGKLLDGGGGGGGGTGGCTTIKITNADGSSTSITQCPAPKTA